MFRIRMGQGDDPGFAHKSGQADPECEDFHATEWFASESPASSGFAIEDAPEELGLVLALEERRWTLLLRVPEVAGAELDGTSLTSLGGAFVDILAGDAKVGRLSALDLRPGVGAARAEVPPARERYATRPVGRWPPSVALDRWSLASAAPLRREGCAFRLRSGEWVRLRAGSRVALGERLLVVADVSEAPPREVVLEEADSLLSAGLTWRAWRVRVPTTPPPAHVAAWMGRLELSSAPGEWSTEIISVPFAMAGDVPQFVRGEAVVIELVPPAGCSGRVAALSGGTNTYELTIDDPGDEAIFALASYAEPSTATIGISASSVDFGFVAPWSAEDVCEALERVPCLRVWIGDRCCEPLRPATMISRAQDIRVDDAGLGVRLHLVVRASRKRRVFADLSVADAERVLREAIGDATAIEIEGGALGNIEITFAREDSTARVATGIDACAGWLRVANTGAPGKRRTPVFEVSPGRPERLRFIDATDSTLARVRLRARRARIARSGS